MSDPVAKAISTVANVLGFYFATIGALTVGTWLLGSPLEERTGPLNMSGKVRPLEFAGDVPQPPVEQMGDIRVTMELTSTARIVDNCGDNAFVVACANMLLKRIFMPNPCPFRETDDYAALLCHELGHINGWDHEEGK